jgi:hypothetical protein
VRGIEGNPRVLVLTCVDCDAAGSVSLWNIKSAMSESDSERTEAEPVEPQRRFQDGKLVTGNLRNYDTNS